MNIYPYSGLASFGQIPVSAANFPCLKHFFPCSETSGTTITDTIGGVTSTFTGLAVSGNGITSTAINNTTSGTFTAFGTNPFIIFAVGKFGTGVIRIGTAVGVQATLTGAAGGAVLTDGVAINIIMSDFALKTAATIYGRAIVVSAVNTASTGSRTYEANTSSTVTALTATPTDATNTGGGALTSMPAISTGSAGLAMPIGTALHGIAMFQFATMPAAATLNAAFAWMTYQWSIGNKSIYPGFKGLS